MAAVFGGIGLFLEREVVLDGTPRVFGLLIFAGSKNGGSKPDSYEDRKRGEESKEDGSLEASTDLPGDVHGNKGQEAKEKKVGEAFGTTSIGWERCILDRRVLKDEELAM